MKDKLVMAALLLLLAACPAEAYAQDATSAQQSVENLRSQLQDIDAKQSALEARMRQLDEDMRPENIEKSLALTGSTRPEELRAQRRQQLEKEKATLQSQLDQLATSRTRLQSAIAAAETATYQQAGGANTTAPQQTSAVNNQPPTTRSVQPQPRPNRKRARRARTRRRSPVS
jgi:peptidoglycan hydrolase CwlO-like protein